MVYFFVCISVEFSKFQDPILRMYYFIRWLNFLSKPKCKKEKKEKKEKKVGAQGRAEWAGWEWVPFAALTASSVLRSLQSDLAQ